MGAMSTALASFMLVVVLMHQSVDAAMSHDGSVVKPSGAQKNRVHVRHQLPGCKQPCAKSYLYHNDEG
jgi:hypothetical protein